MKIGDLVKLRLSCFINFGKIGIVLSVGAVDDKILWHDGLITQALKENLELVSESR